MTLFNKIIVIFGLGAALSVQAEMKGTPLPEVERILQQGFPSQPEVLKQVTTALYAEYQHKHNITSLIFYSYGMLRLAHHFTLINNYIDALEDAKLGFFYLDEAVESHDDNWRIHYLRARVDAYLPADIGRCVITLKDTDFLLENSQKFDDAILAQINYMRYRALLNCQQRAEATQLRTKMETENSYGKKLLHLAAGRSPDWEPNEINKVIIPLVNGE